MPKLAAAAKLPLTWQMSFLYAVTFGGFVAFSTYLPTYLKNVYGFDLTGGRHSNGRLRHRGGDRPADRRHCSPTGSARVRSSPSRSPVPQCMSLIIALRAAARAARPGPPFVLMALLPGARHRRRFRLGCRAGTGRTRRHDHRDRRGMWRAWRLLPSIGDGSHLQRGPAQLHHRIDLIDHHCRRRSGVHTVRHATQDGRDNLIQRAGDHCRTAAVRDAGGSTQ